MQLVEIVVSYLLMQATLHLVPVPPTCTDVAPVPAESFLEDADSIGLFAEESLYLDDSKGVSSTVVVYVEYIKDFHLP